MIGVEYPFIKDVHEFLFELMIYKFVMVYTLLFLMNLGYNMYFKSFLPLY